MLDLKYSMHINGAESYSKVFNLQFALRYESTMRLWCDPKKFSSNSSSVYLNHV